MTMEVSKVLRLPRKLQLIVPNNAKVLRVPTTKRLLARHETCWNVTKCHPCHAKQSYATLGVNATSSELSEHTLNMPQPPDPQSEMATWLRIRENNLILPLSWSAHSWAPTMWERWRFCSKTGCFRLKIILGWVQEMITSNSTALLHTFLFQLDKRGTTFHQKSMFLFFMLLHVRMFTGKHAPHTSFCPAWGQEY